MKTKLTILLVLLTCNLFAQVKEHEIVSRNRMELPNFIKLTETKISSGEQEIKQFLKTQFKSGDAISFKSKKEADTDKLGTKSQKFQQYYKDVKVLHGQINTIAKNGNLKVATGNYVNIENLEIKPVIYEKEALSFALKKIGASKYTWEEKVNEDFIKKEKNNINATYYPQAEMVIVEKDKHTNKSIPVLTYKFIISALEPFSRNAVYVDAKNGEVVKTTTLLCHTTGVADTRYSGQQFIETEFSNGTHQLNDQTRGNGIETRNLNNQFNFASSTAFTDNDNTWTAAEYDNTNKDNAALEVHWAAGVTFDYFLNVHNRNSLDGNGKK